jgi:hypothetical protein
LKIASATILAWTPGSTRRRAVTRSRLSEDMGMMEAIEVVA